jgi:hypothetical protein
LTDALITTLGRVAQVSVLCQQHRHRGCPSVSRFSRPGLERDWH